MARPFLSEEKVAEQQKRLVTAALKLYRAEGYEAVSLRRVSELLDISRVTPYRYFKSKDALFGALRTEVFTRFAEALETAGGKTNEPIDQLRDICLAVVDFARRYPKDYQLIFSLRQASTESYPPLQEARLRASTFVIGVCQRAIDAGQLQGNAKVWAHLAWSSIHGLLSLHVAKLLVVGCKLEDLVEPMLNALLPSADDHQPPKRVVAKRSTKAKA